jgi:hypothetical protein
MKNDQPITFGPFWLQDSFKASSYNLQWDSNLYDFIMEYLSSEN